MEDNADMNKSGPSLEDFVLLQSSLEELRVERDELLTKIQSFEGLNDEQNKLAESQLQEARAQVEALKKNTQKVRERLEAEVRVSAARAGEAERAGETHARARAELEALYNDQSARFEEAAVRLADLETESMIYTAELERVTEENDAARCRIDELSLALEEHAARITAAEEAATEAQLHGAETAASLDELGTRHGDLQATHQALVSERELLVGTVQELRDTIERVESTLSAESTAKRGAEAGRAADARAHEEERTDWERLAADRESELVAARDEVAQTLEAEQSSLFLARQRIDELTAKLCDAESRVAAAGTESLRLEEEIEELRQEQDRQRRVFEASARQREEQHASQAAAEQARFQSEIDQRGAQLRELQHQIERLQEELQGANTEAGRTRQELVRLRSELEDSQLQVATQQAAIESARTHISLLEAQIIERDSEVQRLAARVNTSEQGSRDRDATIVRLGQEAEAAHVQFESEMATVRGSVDTQRLALEAARAQIHALETRAADGDAQRTRLGGHIVELEQAVKDGEAALSAAQRNAEAAARRAAEELHHLSAAAAEKFAALDASRNGLASELTEARARLDKTTHDLEAAQRRVSALESERTQLQGQLAKLSDELGTQAASLAQGQTEAIAERQQSAAERSKLQAEIRQQTARWQEDTARLNSQRQELQAEAQRLVTRVEALSAELTEARANHDATSAALGQAQAEIQARIQQYEQLETESLQLIEGHDTATAELRQRSLERDHEWEQSLADATARYDDLNRELNAARERLESALDESRLRHDQISQIAADLDQARQMNVEQGQAIESLQTHNAALLEQLQDERQRGAASLEEAHSQLAEATALLDKERLHAAEEAERTADTTRELASAVAGARREIAELRTARDQVAEQLAASSALGEKQALELSQLGERLTASEVLISQAQRQSSHDAERLAGLTEQEQALRQRIATLQEETAEQQHTIRTFETQLGELTAELERRQRLSEEAQQRLSDMNRTLELRDARMTELAAQLEAQQQAMRALQDETTASGREAEERLADLATQLQTSDETSTAARQQAGEAALRANERIGELEKNIAALREEQAALLESRTDLERLRDSLRQDLLEAQAATESAENARAQTRDDIDGRIVQLTGELKTRSGELETTRRELGILRESKEMAERSVATAESARRKLATEISQLREQATQAEAALRQRAEKSSEQLLETLRQRDAALAALQLSLDAATAQLAKEELARSQAEQDATAARDQIRAFEAAQQSGTQAATAAEGERRDQLQAVTAGLAEQQRLLTEAEARLVDSDARAAHATAQLEALQEESVSILLAQEVQSEQIAEMTAERAALQGQLNQLQSTLQTAQAEHARLLQEATANAPQRTEDDADRRALSARVEQLSARVRQMELASSDLQKALQEATKARDYATSQLMQRDKDHQSQQQQLTAAEAALKQYRAEAAALRVELTHRTSGAIADVERERNELRTQVETLSTLLRKQGIENAETADQAHQAHRETLAKVEDLVSERQAAQLRLGELETLTSQLERECDRLRRERSSGDEARRFKGEVVRLEARLEELDRQRTEAVQNHSAAVAGYMVELNQRSESLLDREQQLSKISEELVMTRQKLDDAVAQFTQAREERADLERQLDELRKATSTGTTRSGLAFESRTEVTASPPPSRSQLTMQAGASIEPVGPITLIHIDETKDMREALRSLVTQVPGSRYLNTMDIDRLKTTGTTVLAVNLLNRVHDPLAAIRGAINTENMLVFAYCADAQFGFSFGDVTFFAPPLDPEQCISWLSNKRGGSVQRMLAASNNVEMTSSLRSALAKVRCSASVALDMRQVTDLVPMINPEAVLIDLALPRAEGLRLISRIRNDNKTHNLPLGVVLPDKAGLAEFRQHAPRAARESSLSAAQLAQSLAKRLGLSLPEAAVAKAG